MSLALFGLRPVCRYALEPITLLLRPGGGPLLHRKSLTTDRPIDSPRPPPSASLPVAATTAATASNVTASSPNTPTIPTTTTASPRVPARHPLHENLIFPSPGSAAPPASWSHYDAPIPVGVPDGSAMVRYRRRLLNPRRIAKLHSRPWLRVVRLIAILGGAAMCSYLVLVSDYKAENHIFTPIQRRFAEWKREYFRLSDADVVELQRQESAAAAEVARRRGRARNVLDVVD
ncbi:hypothetical protein DFJ73DRAFT_845464 [Zopfochytrium polystomum]|nr:hypothetical protein DFJ73DRAFT_845464 [Zopfochytrium polystomum]